MKRVGILTLPLHHNYGGILQAFALQTHLKEIGYDSVLVNLRHPLRQLPLKQRAKIRIKSHLSKTIFAQLLAERHAIYFRERYVQPATPALDSTSHLSKMFDAFVVGSDQVWRKQYAGTLIYSFFLDFVGEDNIRRVAYAASFGVSDWQFNSSETAKLAKLSKAFDSISVREDSAVELCERFLGVKAKHVLDPTMLIDQSRYISLIEAEGTQKFDGGLYCYILDMNESTCSAINALGLDLGIEPFTVNSKSRLVSSLLGERIFPAVTDWINGFVNAEFVVTDSFHGTVLSILFNRPFLSLGNVERGIARFQSLLKMFNLEDRLITDPQDLDLKRALPDINWKEVNSILIKKRIEATEFLRLALGDS